MKKRLLLFILIVYFCGCTQKQEPEPPPPANYCSGASLAIANEVAECTTSTTYGSPVTITGTASFYKRTINVSAAGPVVTDLVLGAPIATPLPIKYAEVRVVDANGTVVQCGRTDASGALKALNETSPLQISNAAGNYSVQVLSRTNHTVSVSGGKTAFQFYASVKKDNCTNALHSITSTITSTGSGSYNTTILAYARESQSSEVTGGAFNIYNDLTTTYDYLAQSTGTSNLTCLNPKLNVYWKAGFNPAQYIYADQNPVDVPNISFYLRGYNELYINGGKLGNVTSADTDHFDDAVIIHELGHHIEDVCGTMDSPGGTHNGLFRIDPRLAWSEGWGNFIGAHIIRNNTALINPELNTSLTATDGWLYYLDTAGYNDTGNANGASLIRLNLSKAGNNPESLGSGYYYDKVNSTLYPGEGHFREVSIARSLFKTTNTCVATGCTGTNYFQEIWRAFEKNSSGIGLGKSIYPFRTSVRFYNRLNEVFSNSMPSSISTILNTDEAQQRDGSTSYVSGGFTTWVPFGIKLVSTGSTPCSLKIQPRNEDTTVTYGNADQRYSSHFYYFDRNTIPTISEINLTATKNAGTNTDIDLLLYQEGYTFPTETCTATDSGGNCIAYSKNTTSTVFVRSDRSVGSNLAGSYTKRIATLNSLSFSVPYLLNIKAYTAGQTIASNTEYTYTLTDQSGGYLCPAPTF